MSEYAARKAARRIDRQSGYPIVHPRLGSHDLRGGQGQPVQYNSIPRRNGNSRNPGGVASAYSVAERAYFRTTVGGSTLTIAIGITYLILRAAIR